MARRLLTFRERDGYKTEIEVDHGDMFCGLMCLDRTKARELAALLAHFADTGELPGEVGDDK